MDRSKGTRRRSAAYGGSRSGRQIRVQAIIRADLWTTITLCQETRIFHAKKALKEVLDTMEIQEHEPLPYQPSLGARLLEAWSWLKEWKSIPWVGRSPAGSCIIIFLPTGITQETHETLDFFPEKMAVQTDPTYNIVFESSASEAEIRTLLLTIDGNIVSGPSAQGRYVIIQPHGSAREQTIARLKLSNIIFFAEIAC